VPVSRLLPTGGDWNAGRAEKPSALAFPSLDHVSFFFPPHALEALIADRHGFEIECDLAASDFPGIAD
jgi:hypothetical protein